MKKLTIIGAALTLAIPATAYAAADCCKDMSCCGDGADCCENGCCDSMKKGGDHADHDMKTAPAK